MGVHVPSLFVEVRWQLLGIGPHLAPSGDGDRTHVFRLGGKHLYPPLSLPSLYLGE